MLEDHTSELVDPPAGGITTPDDRREREAEPPLLAAYFLACSCIASYANTMHDVSAHVSFKVNSPLVPSGAYKNWMKV